MPEYSIFNLAVQAENMRNSQIAYFQLAAKARKTKAPDDWAAAAKALTISKQIEKSFDETLIEILHPDRKEVHNA